MSRKTHTPKGLSILRKFWAYIGNLGILATYFGETVTDHDMVRIMIVFNAFGFLIQTVCDTYFLKERAEKVDKLEQYR